MRRHSLASLAITLGVATAGACADIVGAPFGDYDGPGATSSSGGAPTGGAGPGGGGSGGGGAGGSAMGGTGGGGAPGGGGNGGAPTVEDCDTYTSEVAPEGNEECGVLADHTVPNSADAYAPYRIGSLVTIDGVHRAVGGASNALLGGTGDSSAGFVAEFSKQSLSLDYKTIAPPTDPSTSTHYVEFVDAVGSPSNDSVFIGGLAQGAWQRGGVEGVQSGVFGGIDAGDVLQWVVESPGAPGAVPPQHVAVLGVATRGTTVVVVGLAETAAFDEPHPSSGTKIFVARFVTDGSSMPGSSTVRFVASVCSEVLADFEEARVAIDQATGEIWVAGRICSPSTLPGGGDTLDPQGTPAGFVSVWSPDLSYATGTILKSPDARVTGLATIAGSRSAIVAGDFTGTLLIDGVAEATSADGSRDVFVARFEAEGTADQPAIQDVMHARAFGGSSDEELHDLALLEGDLSEGIFLAGAYKVGVGTESLFDETSDSLGGAEEKAFVVKAEWALQPDDVHAIWARFLGEDGRTEAYEVLPAAADVWIAGAVGHASAAQPSGAELSSNITIDASDGQRKWFLARYADDVVR